MDGRAAKAGASGGNINQHGGFYFQGQENYIMMDWLWIYFGIIVLFLPTRTPEWNPNELV